MRMRSTYCIDEECCTLGMIRRVDWAYVSHHLFKIGDELVNVALVVVRHEKLPHDDKVDPYTISAANKSMSSV